MNDYDRIHYSPPAPVARVTLRDSATNTLVSGVILLIDTGADVTLLPRWAIVRLGVVEIPDTHYELQGFDGTTSEAPVVELELHFLRRRFVGRYLIVDQESGVLGRDLLNHVALLLDGPGQRWLEYPR